MVYPNQVLDIHLIIKFDVIFKKPKTHRRLHISTLPEPIFIIIIIIIIMALQRFVGPWPLFQFLLPIHSR
jgi:hypothetical protein